MSEKMKTESIRESVGKNGRSMTIVFSRDPSASLSMEAVQSSSDLMTSAIPLPNGKAMIVTECRLTPGTLTVGGLIRDMVDVYVTHARRDTGAVLMTRMNNESKNVEVNSAIQTLFFQRAAQQLGLVARLRVWLARMILGNVATVVR